MVLNQILELCEEHMQEGDYLQSASLLRMIHERTHENNTITFETPIIIKKVEEGNEFEIVKVKGFKWNSDERSYNIKVIIEEIERNFELDLYTSFDNYIMLKLETNFICNIKIENSILPNNFYYAKDIIKRLQLISKLEDRELDFDSEFICNDINITYKNIIIDIVKYTCRMARSGRAFE
jgi:hypothetical protein